MKIKRREFIAALPFVFSMANTFGSRSVSGAEKMYGLIGKMITAEGKRDELIKILLEGTNEMPGCISYIVAKDAADKNAIWGKLPAAVGRIFFIFKRRAKNGEKVIDERITCFGKTGVGGAAFQPAA